MSVGRWLSRGPSQRVYHDDGAEDHCDDSGDVEVYAQELGEPPEDYHSPDEEAPQAAGHGDAEAQLTLVSATPVYCGSARQRRTTFDAVLGSFLVALTAFDTIDHMKSTDI